MKNKYITGLFLTAILAVSGYFIYGNTNNVVKENNDVAVVNNTQNYIWTSDSEIVTEFESNAFNASKKYSNNNTFVRINGTVSYISPNGNFLFARNDNNQTYEVAVVPNNSNITQSIESGKYITLLAKFRTIEGKLIVLDAHKIVGI